MFYILKCLYQIFITFYCSRQTPKMLHMYTFFGFFSYMLQEQCWIALLLLVLQSPEISDTFVSCVVDLQLQRLIRLECQQNILVTHLKSFSSEISLYDLFYQAYIFHTTQFSLSDTEMLKKNRKSTLYFTSDVNLPVYILSSVK